MNDLFEKLGALRIVPIVTIEEAKDAVPLARALAEGGLPCIEVTLRTPAALESLRRIADLGEVLLGAGTVLTPAQADEAAAAGARFLVSPGLNPSVVRHCLGRNLPILPGTATATDLETALSLGITTVKFFPAEPFGGIRTLKALSGPFPMMRFLPTGGIGPEELPDYLAFPKVLACGGSWMTKPDMIRAGKFAEVTRLARRAVRLSKP